MRFDLTNLDYSLQLKLSAWLLESLPSAATPSSTLNAPGEPFEFEQRMRTMNTVENGVVRC